MRSSSRLATTTSKRKTVVWPFIFEIWLHDTSRYYKLRILHNKAVTFLLRKSQISAFLSQNRGESIRIPISQSIAMVLKRKPAEGGQILSQREEQPPPKGSLGSYNPVNTKQTGFMA